LAVVAALVFASTAGAENAPKGYILDVGAQNNYGVTPLSFESAYQQGTSGPPLTYPYTYYSQTFTATQTSTTVTFAFRNDPLSFFFDDASVALSSGGPNLLADPGFETATVGGNSPAGWTYLAQSGVQCCDGFVINSYDAVGNVAGNTNSPGDPNSGLNFWTDGVTGGYDGLAQTIATTVGDQYTVGFYLGGDNIYSGGYRPNFDPPYLDVYVYAGEAFTSSTFNGVPEPASWALMLAGFAGLGAALRKTRTSGVTRPA
jgi:hypothetical protein